MTRRRGRPWLQGGVQKNFGQKNFGLNFRSLFAGKRKPYTALLQCRTSLCRKMGSTEERFRWWIWFPGFYRVFVSTTGLESFSLRPEKFSKRFFFRGGCVRFFLLCIWGKNSLSRILSACIQSQLGERHGCPTFLELRFDRREFRVRKKGSFGEGVFSEKTIF